MTLRIERVSAQGRTVVRLMGRVQSECLPEIEAQLEGAKPPPRSSPQELVDRMMVLHGDLGNPYTLWAAAQAVFEQGQESGAANPRMQEAHS
jgi:hypothetical protein